MATWELSTVEKKNAVERQYWIKDGVIIAREEGFRWGTFYCESDEKPNIDLNNEDGLILADSDYEWELDMLDDGCWGEWEFPDDMDEEEQQRIIDGWDEDSYDFLEGEGWVNDDTDFILHGPLMLTNKDTGEEFTGE